MSLLDDILELEEETFRQQVELCKAEYRDNPDLMLSDAEELFGVESMDYANILDIYMEATVVCDSSSPCQHEWLNYQGLSEEFKYCKCCGVKE